MFTDRHHHHHHHHHHHRRRRQLLLVYLCLLLLNVWILQLGLIRYCKFVRHPVMSDARKRFLADLLQLQLDTVAAKLSVAATYVFEKCSK